MEALRVGVIGTGFGARVQIPAFRAHPRAAVVAVASATPGKAHAVAAHFDVPLAFDDYEEMLAKAHLDLVTITSPPHTHHPMTLAALAHGRHVLCEKPMALHAAQAEAMLHHAQRRGVVHVIDHELRFNPNRQMIKRLIAQGFIGTPRHALLTASGTDRADKAVPWSWWSDASQGGGVLGAWGSHRVDLLRYWLGEPVAVTGSVETFVTERPTVGGAHKAVTADDFTTFSVRFASGAIGTVVIDAVASHDTGRREQIWGEEGTLLLDENERLWGARRGEQLSELTAPETLVAPPGMAYAPLWGLSFVRLADHVVRAILDGASIAPAATFEDGVVVQRVLDAVRAGAEHWRSVTGAERSRRNAAGQPARPKKKLRPT